MVTDCIKFYCVCSEEDKNKNIFSPKNWRDRSTLLDWIFRKILCKSIGLDGNLELPLIWTIGTSYFSRNVNLNLYICMVYATAKQNISKLNFVCLLHTTSQTYIWKPLNEKNQFPSYQQLRDLAYVQRSEFAASYITDTSNLNARQNVKARLECIQEGLFTWGHFYLDSQNYLLILMFQNEKARQNRAPAKHSSPKTLLNKSFSVCKFAQTLPSIWRHHNKARTNLIHKCN